MELLTWSYICGRYWDRTSDLLGVNQAWAVARRSWAWPYMPFTCEGAGSLWPDVAWCLGMLAPILAPRISLARHAESEANAGHVLSSDPARSC